MKKFAVVVGAIGALWLAVIGVGYLIVRSIVGLLELDD